MIDLLYKEFVNDICMEATNNQSLKLSSFALTTKKVMLGKNSIHPVHLEEFRRKESG